MGEWKLIGNKQRFTRLSLAWAVLHGRPVAYRLHIDGQDGIVLGATRRGRGSIAECRFTGDWRRPSDTYPPLLPVPVPTGR
jgi:hypothetical protein